MPSSRRNFLNAGAALGLPPGGASTAEPLLEELLAGPPRGPWRRLFLDAMVVEESRGLERVWYPLEKHAGNPVVRRDQPWEGASAISGPYVYGTVMPDGGRLRMWYQCLFRGNHVGTAESRDGVTWTKPRLGLIEYEGARDNNLVISNWQPEVTGGVCHNPSVIKLAEPRAGNRYALFCFEAQAKHARVAFSPDGYRWTFAPQTRERPLFTSSDVVNFFWDPLRTRFTATWKTGSRRGRAVGVAWSDDGLTWTKPLDGPVFVADDNDPDATQVYGMPVFPYQGLYLGLPWLYHARYFKSGAYTVPKLHEAQSDSPRTIDVQLAWSWDLINWTRPPQRVPFLTRGEPGAFDAGMVFTARAPVIVGDRLYFYYGGCDRPHDSPGVIANIGLATLRLDGFCAMQARGSEEGWLVTRREALTAARVTINARTAPDGYLEAELLDRQNRVLPGGSRADGPRFRGDAIRQLLEWKAIRLGAGSLDDVKVRFWLKNAELYSYTV